MCKILVLLSSHFFVILQKNYSTKVVKTYLNLFCPIHGKVYFAVCFWGFLLLAYYIHSTLFPMNQFIDKCSWFPGSFLNLTEKFYLAMQNCLFCSSLVFTHWRISDVCIHLLRTRSLVCGHFLQTCILTSYKIQYVCLGKDRGLRRPTEAGAYILRSTN